MTITVRAAYANGVLNRVEPLALAEGETVDVTISRKDTVGPLWRAPTPAEEEYARRIKAAQSLEEMYAIMATAPGLPEGYDLCQALNANRAATGERLLLPEPDGGSEP